MSLSLTTLLVRETKATLYALGLEVATSLGLPVTSWQAGDPTRSVYHFVAEILSRLEDMIAGFIESGFLDHATGDWLTILAKQVYNVDRVEATFATTEVTLTNASGAVYVFASGDITFKSSLTDQTYHNTSGGTLLAGATLDLDVEADVAGSDGSAGIGEIDELVTVYLGVTCSNAAAAVGVDEEEDEALRGRCRDKLAALSPNGPAEAYSYVATNSDLTGTTAVTRARVFSESNTGDVTVYLAGASGAVQEADRALVEAAILLWATPLCITPTVLAATNLDVPVTYTLWVYERVNEEEADVEEAVETALRAMFAARPIGGDFLPGELTGSLFRDLVVSTIRETFPDDTFHVTVDAPANDTALTNAQVARLGTVTPTITFVDDP